MLLHFILFLPKITLQIAVSGWYPKLAVKLHGARENTHPIYHAFVSCMTGMIA